MCVRMTSLHGWFDDGRHICTSPYLLCTQLMHASLQCLASIVHENRISANIVTDGTYVYVCVYMYVCTS